MAISKNTALEKKVSDDVSRILCRCLDLEPGDLDVAEDLEEYGFDSITVVELTAEKLMKPCGLTLMATLLAVIFMG